MKRTEVVHLRPFPCPSLHRPSSGTTVRVQGPVLMVRECRSTCLSNLWLAHVPTLRNGPAPTPNTINTRAHRAQGFIVVLVSTGSASPRSRSRDLRLGSLSYPPSLGSGQIPLDDLSKLIGVLVITSADN